MSLFKHVARAAIIAALAVPAVVHAQNVAPPADKSSATVAQAPAPGSMSAQSAMAPDASVPASATVPAATSPGAATTDAAATNPVAPSAPAAGASPADAVVVSNAPVPDTRANRAKYGRPLSHAGNLTDPAGN